MYISASNQSKKCKYAIKLIIEARSSNSTAIKYKNRLLLFIK
jgi:hypothetical protein